MEKKGKFKTSHKFYEQKGEFGSPSSEFLLFKWDTPIMLGP
jgi:hypothetical protein